MHSKPASVPKHKVRFVTAASLFDGHDAAINIMRRILQAHGAEVIHLGHNRSVAEIVDAAIQEDAQGIAVSSYQGGHMEFFTYMVDLLRERGADHVKVFGGGGGVIVSTEIEALEAYGVTKIFSPEDGRRLGLDGMIESMIEACDFDPAALEGGQELGSGADRWLDVARAISRAEAGRPVTVAARTTPRPRARHHRHRRRRQVVADRRAGAAVPGRLPRADDRHPLGRPDQAQDRRRPARRPHPPELARLRPGLHALARDPSGPPGAVGDTSWRRSGSARARAST